jgi:hypothetical protein
MNNKFLKMAFASLVLGVSSFANAGLITTTYAGGNANEGVMFDITTFDNDINVTGIDLNFDDIGATTIEVYSRLGSYEGFEGSSIGWALMSSTILASTNARGTPTFLDLTDFALSANTTYGIYFYSTNHAVDLEYTNGANTYSNSDVSIVAGVGINDFFDGVNRPRTWNGTVFYDVNEVPEPSTLAIFALGLMGLASRRFMKKS